ncbi:MAG: glycosyltransferase WbuB [Bacteroidetes bacterium HGW-Bacteroidetes-6]|jgi:glycosyltransferase involved in cell wall biosynthesis|nr:MAG: glycosyltransferase WbuB [Bacteroidetes bacterium HGW-Bacteroidetes-6]
MKIMLINHYAGSPTMGMEYRPWYLAQEWIKTGHEVVIVAATNAHVRNVQPEIQNTLQEEIIDGIAYLWVKTPAYNGNGLKRILNMRSFVRKLRKNASKLAQKYQPDVVIASSTYPMDNYAAQKIARKAGAKHFYEVHDLWPLSPMELGGYKASHPFIRYLQRAEDFAYKHADGVISMLPKTAEYMQSRGLDLRKWHYVPNGINTQEWNSFEHISSELETKIQQIRDKFQYIVGYTGSHGVSNALSTLISTAKLLRNKSIAFILIGKGPDKQNLILEAESADLNNIFFFDPISKQQIPHVLSFFDILYIGLQRQSLYRFGISLNKLYDYMMAAKPVLLSIEDSDNLVNKIGCGFSVEPENPEEQAKRLESLIQMTPKQRKEMGEAGKAYVLQHHDYSVLAAQFIQILQQ